MLESRASLSGMAVYNSMGALPAARGAAPKTLGKRKLPATASKTSAATAVAARIAARPVSSNTGLPGALAPPAPKTLGKRKLPAPIPATASAPTLGKRKLPSSSPSPGPAPSSGGGSAIASGDYEWHDGGDDSERFEPLPAPSGGPMVRPASDVEIVPPGGDVAPKDGISKWAAFAGIAACVLVGAFVLHQRGVI